MISERKRASYRRYATRLCQLYKNGCKRLDGAAIEYRCRYWINRIFQKAKEEQHGT